MPHAELTQNAQHIELHTAPQDRFLVKLIPGVRYVGASKTWHLPLTWPACLQLRGVFGNTLTVGPRLVQWATEERGTRVDPAMTLRTRIVPTEDRCDSGLYPFQQAGVEFLALAGSALLGDEMGTGKTIQLLDGLQRVSGDALPALVICPNSTKTNWAREAGKWFPTATPYVIMGSAKAKQDLLKIAKTDPRALVIINIEAVRSFTKLATYGSTRLKKCNDCLPTAVTPTNIKPSQCEAHPRELNDFGFKTVIFDEAHRIKDPNAKQTRAAWAVGHDPSVLRRWAATGTPIANDPSDLWAIMHFVKPEEYPAKTTYVDRYCLQAFNGFGGLSVIGIKPEVRGEFYGFFDTRFRRVTKDLVLHQLPKKTYTQVRVDMSPSQAKTYREMEDGLVTRLEDGSLIIAPTNLTAQIRLLQFAAAKCVTDETGKVTLTDASPKIDAFMEIVEDAGKPIVACAEHKQIINIAAARLKKACIPYGLITGDISQWERQKALDDFDAGRTKVLLFTIKAGGTGLNMTAADTIVFIQRSWSMIENKQSEDRVHRIGSEKHESITVIDLVMNDTVEVDMLERYVIKLRRLQEITRDRERLQAEGIDTHHLDQLEDQILNSYLGELV